MQLSFDFAPRCIHLVRRECFESVPGCWSPYDVAVCEKCAKVFQWPRIEFLVTWPAQSVERLVNFMTGP